MADSSPPRKRRNSLLFPARVRDRYENCPVPNFRKPVEIGSFSVNGCRQYVPDQHQLKYYRPPPTTNRVHFDLSVNYEKAAHRTAKGDEEKLDNLLRWIADNMNTVVDANQRVQADVVCYRGLLTKLVCTPYEMQQGWCICATKFRGTLYLCSFETEEDVRRQETMTERDKLMTSWGYKFEAYVTSSTSNGKPDGKEPVNENEEFCLVAKARLSSHSIICGAEVDCIDPDQRERYSMDKYIELKTSRHLTTSQQHRNFKRFKLIKWWAQSFLLGIDEIICGFRDDNGIVHTLQKFQTVEIPNIAEEQWDAAVCLNFCDQFLSFLKKSITIDDPKVVYMFEWRPREDVCGYKLNQDSKYQILPEWYVSKFQNNVT